MLPCHGEWLSPWQSWEGAGRDNDENRGHPEIRPESKTPHPASSMASLRAAAVRLRARGLSAASAGLRPEDVCIVGAMRTPIGGFNGSLASFTAPNLGAKAILAALSKAELAPGDVEEVYMGNVLSAGMGQAPARQAALQAGIPHAAVCTTVNKVCASGMKSLMLASQQILLHSATVVVAGGMESMTNVPYYLPKARFGARMGDAVMVDGMVKDGLWDPYNDFHMGMCAEECAITHDITRDDQDAHAMESYSRSQAATSGAKFAPEIAELTVEKARKGDPQVVTTDEEVANDASRLPNARPAFKKDGTVTAGNSSTLSDGAAALVLTTGAEARRRGLPVMARVVGFADAAQVREAIGKRRWRIPGTARTDL